MKFKANESMKDNIAQRVKAQDQLSKRIGKDPLSWSLSIRPVKSPLAPVGRKNIRVPLVSSRMASNNPIINQIFPEYKRISSIICFTFI